MQLPPYIDRGLPHKPSDLPLVLQRECGSRLEWRRVATCVISGRPRDICLGFVADAGHAACIGLLAFKRDEVGPLIVDAERRLTLITPERSEHDPARTGVSLLFLEQATYCMEGELRRNFEHMNQLGRGDESAVIKMIPDVFGSLASPESIPPEDALSLIAATKAVRAFFSVRIFGGADSMGELIAAFNYLNGALGPEMQGADALACDLEWLAGVPANEWTDQHKELQQRTVAFIIALLCNMRARDEPVLTAV